MFDMSSKARLITLAGCLAATACALGPDTDDATGTEDPRSSRMPLASDTAPPPTDLSLPPVLRAPAPLTDAEVEAARRALANRPRRLRIFDTSTVDPSAQPTPDGGYRFDFVGKSGRTHTVRSQGRAATVRSIVRAAERLAQPDNDLALLDIVADAGALPPGFRVPNERGARVEAARALKQILKSQTPVKPSGPSPFDASVVATCADEIGSGLMLDSQQCPKPAGLFSQHWFPLRSAMNCVRDQGNRGTCSAFAVAGATEVAWRIKHGAAINLSEQGLYARGMNEWQGVDYGDGLFLSVAFDQMMAHHYQFPWEKTWDYNPSPNRVEVSPYYVLSCLGYPEKCSDTTHQLPYGGGGFTDLTAGSSLISLAGYFGLDVDDDIPIAKFLLTAKIPLVLGFEETTGFKTLPPDDRIAYYDGAATIGGHSVMIVGFVEDSALPPYMKVLPEDGGGYFIVRNSWGCDYADAGYVYMPYAYAATYGNELYALSVE